MTVKRGLRAIVCAAAFVASANTQAEVLPDCTIDFETTCPDMAPECGASFSGGGTCAFIGQGNCYSSGLRSYSVTPAAPLTITLSGELTGLDVFFADQLGTGQGDMRFFDAEVGGNEVGSTLISNGPCQAMVMPALQAASLVAPVRRVEVTATAGTLWIDDFHINGGPSPFAVPAVSEWGLVIMGALVLVAGTLVFRRRMCLGAEACA